MAHTATLRLKTDVDNTVAAELTPRLKTAIHEALTAARTTGVEDEAGAAAYAVVVEILRVRQATPAETAIDRVRALHREEYGACAECTRESSELYPCATIRALDEMEPAEPMPVSPQLAEQLREAIESEVYEYRERTMFWEETGGVTEEIARLATRGAMNALTGHS